MKAIFIVFNQAHTERVEYILDKLGIRGYSWWSEVKGRGSVDGEPRQGTHTWPEMNSALIAIVEEEKVKPRLEWVKKVDEINREVAIRAFVWSINEMY